MDVYVLEGGLRRVSPYFYEYKTPFRPRWANLTVKQVLCTELGQLPTAVDSGLARAKIWVTANNGKSGGPALVHNAALHLLQPHDIIYNLQHMHEPALSWLEENNRIHGKGKVNGEDQEGRFVRGVLLLFESSEFLVVSKPRGTPMHPLGIYRRNTLCEILKHEFQCNLWPCHRLDKPTLGVVVFGKTKKTALEIMRLLAEKGANTRKTYVARVRGEFPMGKFHYKCPVFTLNGSGGYINVPNVKHVSADSTTAFERMEYFPDSDESIVQCQPISGKMHQIRVHLRNVGFPICNDPLYAPASAINERKNGIERKLYGKIFEMWGEFGKMRPEIKNDGKFSDLNIELPSTIDVLALLSEDIRDEISQLAAMREENEKTGKCDICPECERQIFPDHPDKGIYLHALKMSHKSDQLLFSFETDLPQWCKETGGL